MTRLGLGAALVGVALTAMGWVMTQPGLWVVGTASVALVVLGWAFVLRRPAVSIERRIAPARVTKGLPALAYLTAHNRGSRTLPSAVVLQAYGDRSVVTVLPRLAPGERAQRTSPLPTNRRGVFPVGPVELPRSDPLGLVRRVRRCTGPGEVWVTPRVLPLRPLPSGATHRLEGPSADTAREGAITFHRLRDYVPGDDIRKVHWKSVARTGALVVRHDVDPAEPFTVIVLDTAPEPHSATGFETAVDVAASVALVAGAGHAPVELRTSGGDRVGGSGRTDPAAIVDHLTLVRAQPGADLERTLRRLRLDPGGTALVVVTGRPSPSLVQLLGALGHRFHRRVLVAVAPSDGAERRPSGVAVIAATEPDEIVAEWNVQVRG